jgi:hypothetical protein
MLRRLASPPSNPPGPPELPRVEAILQADPAIIAYALESAWQMHSGGGGSASGSYWLTYGLGSFFAGTETLDQFRSRVSTTFAANPRRILWDHLIYAYMIENTRAYEIFTQVVRQLLQGERLGILQSDESFRWLRTTEELFLKDASPYQQRALVSRVRPDIRASRRNAYYRMFGMDLNHGADGGGAYAYEKPDAANREFVAIFEEFLRETWRGIENSDNTSGTKPTDDATIANLALRLQNMLNARRGSTLALNLSREEFEFVNTMAWFHLTLVFDTAIVSDLKVTATSPEERLRLLGERVGIPAHARSHSYFRLAPALSTLLRQVEAGDYSDASRVPDLYAPAPNPIRNMMATIIAHWSMASGRDLKGSRVTVAPSASIRTSTPPALAETGVTPTKANGRAAVAASA